MFRRLWIQPPKLKRWIGTSAAAGGTIAITNPVQYRTFQRSGTTGTIAINGTYTGTPTAIEASFNGGAYATIDAAPSGGTYSGNLTNQTQGQGTLTVRFTNDIDVNASRTYIGIGEIFVIAGQSNAVGECVNNNPYYHPTLKACLFGNDYVWKELVDPVDDPTNQVDTVSEDDTYGGSLWPILATYIMQNQGVPVAFVPCPLLGTTISQWQPGGNHLDRATLYGSMNYRAQQMGGARAILWWQGESDSVNSTPEATYNAYLDTLANSFYSDRGVKIMPCKIMDLDSGMWQSDETPINNAIVTAWGDNSNVLTGPDFNDYKLSEHGGDIHYPNSYAYIVASRWWQAIREAFSWTDHSTQSATVSKQANTVVCTFHKNVTAGHLLVVHVSQYGGTIMNSTSIADSAGNGPSGHYVVAGAITQYTGDNSLRYGIYYAWNVTGGAITVTFSGSGSPLITMTIEEYPDVLPSSDPLDKTATGNTDEWLPTMDSGNTAAIAQADELLIGGATPYSSALNFMRPGTNYVLREEYPSPDVSPIITMSRVVSAIAAYNATAIQASTTNGWIAKIVTFKLGAGPTTSPVMQLNGFWGPI